MLGYSSYDASTFAVTTVDFEGDNLYLDLSLCGKPNLFLEITLSSKVEFGLRMENVSAFNSLFGNSADATMVTPRVDFPWIPRAPIVSAILVLPYLEI